ncbi:sodium/hydrogen exchanger [Rhodomicrobium vannielii ATCC 17100]|uniref:Sodium/hydrogen exchanger n=1 Tax=Rhodomicrobium vannielii (strain ATCC 17100 / DSM 162 / LMG 4299 / NCIMB 10020 / ATH 3.1.1) TaxID=648757 RepID=E3I7F0_RHOVT|nr:cation:proton antiporter [Rhodomicrobium vannielii]ADP71869.1 sodium/hydrogen exchanger [Rhodomicrobium vannielii ATCC 17100]
MSASINMQAYSDALVVLGTAGIIIPMVHAWGLSPVLGWLGAGVLLGPLGLGSFIPQAPFLYWFTVVDPSHISGFADLGVVFLLFLIGLELSYERLIAMRRLVFGLGGLQVAITAAIIAIIVKGLGYSGVVAAILGGCLALSSTAIVLEVLSRQNRLRTSTGIASFSVLLAQDLAVIPILIFVSILGAHGGSVIETAEHAVVHALAAIAIIIFVGRAFLRPLFRQVARTKSRELFIAATLFVIVGTGVVAALANLSMALGAFVAGVLLAETEYRHAIETVVEPVKGLLLGMFFFTVGMGIDFRELLHWPIWLPACVVGLIALKAAILIPLARAFGVPWAAAIESGLLMGPGGEFAFVGITLAASLGVINRDASSFSLAVTSLTMALIPLLSILANRITPLILKPRPINPAVAAEPLPQTRHAIVVGYGRVGRVVCEMLEKNGVPYTAVDSDTAAVTQGRAIGHSVYYGNAINPPFLKACGVMDASAVVVTIHVQPMIDDIVEEVRRLRPDVPIISRARDEGHARHLYTIGVTDAVPVVTEASFQLAESTLLSLGLPVDAVEKTIQARRAQVRAELQPHPIVARPREAAAGAAESTEVV